MQTQYSYSTFKSALKNYQGRYKNYAKVQFSEPHQILGDVKKNLECMKNTIQSAYQEGGELIIFPALALTGNASLAYLLQKELAQEASSALQELLVFTKAFEGLTLVLGSYRLVQHQVLQEIYVIEAGQLKSLSPEGRFELTLKHQNGSLRATLTVDVFLGMPLDLLKKEASASPADVLIHLSQEMYTLSTSSQLSSTAQKHSIYQSLSLLNQQTVLSLSPYYKESSAEFLYGSEKFCFEKGISRLVQSPWYGASEMENTAFFIEFDETLYQKEQAMERALALPAHQIFTREFSKTPFLTVDYFSIQPKPVLEEARQGLEMLAEALALRVQAAHAKKMVLGLSGGLDSTLALVVAVKACALLKVEAKDMLLCVTLPGFGTSEKTHSQAFGLAKTYGVDFKEISIVSAVKQHFQDIEQDISLHDVTYENAQARERTQILMDLANKHQGIVLGTGDMSEIALGFCTYNGDHMSMYGVNSSVPKSMIPYFLAVEQEASIKNNFPERAQWLQEVIDTPISPELLPNQEHQSFVQKTENILGPYALHDFFLYHFLTEKDTLESLYFKAEQSFIRSGIYDSKTVLNSLKTFVRRFITQQFKRSCSAEGITLYPFSLSPRTGYCLPADTPLNFYQQQLLRLEESLEWQEDRA